jgi:hypothetical protein
VRCRQGVVVNLRCVALSQACMVNKHSVLPLVAHMVLHGQQVTIFCKGSCVASAMSDLNGSSAALASAAWQ